MDEIPKILHYCWFGGNAIPQRECECIENWRLNLPNYELTLWNEENFDIESHPFTREAYAAKKYAFVSDFVRAKVLYEHGGLYLDSDVEVLKNFDSLFDGYDLVCGFETRRQIGTAAIACKAGNKVIKEFYNFYLGHNFKTSLGYNIIANVAILTSLLEKRGLQLGGERQILDGGILVLNRELFYPKKISEDEFMVTNESVAIHKCSNSWMSDAQRRRGSNRLWIKYMRPILLSTKRSISSLLGEKIVMNIEILTRRVLK